MSSIEIDKQVSAAKSEGKSLYYIEEEMLRSISPDIIFTQDVCEVCQIDTAEVMKAIAHLDQQPKLIPLLPKSLDDVFQNILTIADAFGHLEKGQNLVDELKNRLLVIASVLQQNNVGMRNIMVVEWIEPLFNSGHWIPDMIDAAGGKDELATPHGYSHPVSWESLLEYDPEVIIIAPCGFNVDRSLQELKVLSSKPQWLQLKAVLADEVYVADAKFFTEPGVKLVDGIELMAAILHPGLFAMPLQMQPYYKKVNLSTFKTL